MLHKDYERKVSVATKKQWLSSSWMTPISTNWRQTTSRKAILTLTLSELVVERSPADMNVNTEAEDTTGIHHQKTTGEDVQD
jgi:hypothetical protein